MRKCLGIMPVLLLFAAIGASNAQADTLFTYTYTNTNAYSWTTEPIPVVTAPTTLTAAELTATSLFFNYTGCVITQVVLDQGTFGGITFQPGGQETDFVSSTCGGTQGSYVADQFAIADYGSPGTYIGATSQSTLVVNTVQTPEPSTGGLMLIGIGLVFVMRKRIGQGLHQQAT